jgi:hypothetical protein
MMSDMPGWLPTVLIAVFTTLMSTFTVQMFLAPGLQMRMARILAVHGARDELWFSVIAIMSAVVRLERLDDTVDGAANALQGERRRLWEQIDLATRSMDDKVSALLLRRHTGSNFLMLRYVLYVREAMLCEISRADRRERVWKLTRTARNAVFTPWWRPLARRRGRQELESVFAHIDELHGRSFLL